MVKSQAEQQALAPKITQRTFIGLYRDPKDISRWLWLDGTRPKYTHWYKGEPNDLKEKCGEIYPPIHGWRWNDIACTETLHYVCETKGM